jgi:hypothetical protein
MTYRTDANQAEIVADLRAVPGIDVINLAMVGDDCPDILVGFRGANYLIELKMPGKHDNLSDGQKKFFLTWPGYVRLATSADEILRLIGAI